MAMIKCIECGEEISSDAKVCPKCGKNQQATKGNIDAIRSRMHFCDFIGIILCGIGIAAFPFGFVSPYTVLALAVGLLFYIGSVKLKRELKALQ